MHLFRLMAATLVVALSFPLSAATYVLPTQGNSVGEIQYTQPEGGETLDEIGRRFGMGYQEMVQANPQVDPVRPLSPQSRIKIPSRLQLPAGPRRGIVIDLHQFRLFFYPSQDNVVITYPVGIGQQGWETPVGETRVVKKERDPVWRPTPNVRAEAAKNGTPIPNAFPPGPDNPLGRHVLRLGWPTYLIHGTNRAEGVGTRVSAGCIRMLPRDIAHLYELVPVGTPVRVQ